MSRSTGRFRAVEQVTDVFRRSGYEGASLSALSTATGLGRSSLYNYFPGGKEDMARSSLALVSIWIDTLEEEVLAEQPMQARLDRLSAGLDALYVGGRTPCLLGAFSVGPEPAIADVLGQTMRRSMDLMIRILVDDGAAQADARASAEDATARVQGALILARTIGDTGPFERALNAIRRLGSQ